MFYISWERRKAIVASWALMSSPYPLITIIAVYLWIVFKAGPEFMKNRKPFNLKIPLLAYNIYQIAACSCFVYQAYTKLDYSILNAGMCFEDPRLTGKVDEKLMFYNRLTWYFVLLRMSEFIETIFFILRKKSNQLSILHVYHHISTVVFIWISLLYSNGLMEMYIGITNSAVHVIMYSYYFLSSFKIFKGFVTTVKPLMTSIQIAQLLLIFIHSVAVLLPRCKAPWTLQLQAVNAGLLILLFLNFSFQTFIKRKAVKKIE